MADTNKESPATQNSLTGQIYNEIGRMNRLPGSRRFKHKFKMESADLSAWEREKNKICVWHYIVRGVLVSRHISKVDDISPEFYFNKSDKMCCIIARVYDANYPEDQNFDKVGAEDPDDRAKKHIFVVKPKRDPESETDVSGELINDRVANNGKKMRIEYGIYGTGKTNEVRFTYKVISNGEKNAIGEPKRFSNDIRWAPVWYFFEGTSPVELINNERLEESPVLNWSKASEIFTKGINNGDETETIFKNLKEAGCNIMVRLYIKDINAEAHIGESSEGEDPS